MTARLADGRSVSLVLPKRKVFEDTAPRLADVDGDGAPEIVAVESDAERGARLTIWRLGDGELRLLAASPHIGARFRWLAPVSVADLDGDGSVEIVWVDRPHLARVLRVWRYRDGALHEVARAPGHTNHRFGEREISGGLRDCGAGPELITASADWRRLRATRLASGGLESRDIGRNRGPASFDAALRCATR